MKKTLFFLLVTAFACIISTATASPVDKQKALTVATHFIQARGGIAIHPYANYGRPGTRYEQLALHRMENYRLN